MQAHRPGHLVFPSFVTMPADLPTYVEASRSITYTQAWNLAGLAAISVPVGRAGKMALSAQLVAPDEALVLQAAAALEGMDM